MSSPRIPQKLLQRARDLRRDMTFPEKLLWGRLKGRQVLGLKFRKQHPIEPFIVVFYCAERRLVIEVDGASHDDPDYDEWRTGWLENAGYRVVRYTNDDVIENVDAVVEYICEIVRGLKRQMPPSPGPSLQSQGGEESQNGLKT